MFPGLPKYQGKVATITNRQSTEDIIEEVVNAHNHFSKDYNYLVDYFNISDPELLAAKLFNFCKQHIRYVVEDTNLQTTRSPATILKFGKTIGGDCKHYAAMVAGIIDALNRHGENFNWVYRFASYDPDDKTPTHVFIVLKDNGNEFWIDPVLDYFNSRDPEPTFYIDKKPKKMALKRLSGTNALYYRPGIGVSPPGTTNTTNPTLLNTYDQAANKLALDGLITSSIPFYSVAKGLIENFFGKGGISDWLSPTGILNELKFALFGRMYRGGQYWLGEKFKYYVLGEDIHTRDADVVTDQAVATAITVFSTGFGVPIEDYQDILNLAAGRDAYINRYVQLGANRNDINIQAVDRAVQLKRLYFPFMEVTKGVVPQKWDVNNFNQIKLVAPIPDFTAPYANMWQRTYTGAIPDGNVVNGVVVAGKLAGASSDLQQPGMTAFTNMSATTWLIIGAVAVGGYMLLKKGRR